MKHPANPSRRAAFTLVEMLIVISIIGLLAALLFPVFARVREGARTTSCSSNLRQLGLAFTQYTQDYGGRLPRAANYQAWSPGHAYWVAGTPGDNGQGLAGDASPFTYKTGSSADVANGALFPYVKSEGVYVCPSTQDADKKKLGYSMNCAVSMLSQTRIRTPADIILLMDEGQSLNDGFFWAQSGTQPTDELTKAHNGGGNILFCDGHVKFYQFDALPIMQGAAVRTATTGSPRFRDNAFGANGVAATGFVSYSSATKDKVWPTTGAACPISP